MEWKSCGLVPASLQYGHEFTVSNAPKPSPDGLETTFLVSRLESLGLGLGTPGLGLGLGLKKLLSAT